MDFGLKIFYLFYLVLNFIFDFLMFGNTDILIPGLSWGFSQGNSIFSSHAEY